MSEEDRDREGEQVIRRILVALDASPHSLAALRAAAEIAAALDADLLGLYVEDINLLRMAELPTASEFTIYSSAPRQLDRRKMEQQLHMQARQARRALEDVAKRLQLRWSFRVAQGLIAAELLAAAQESDLILLGRSGWSKRQRLGSTTRIIIDRATQHAMVVSQDTHFGLPVGVVYIGEPQSHKALAAAEKLLLRQEGFLVVMIVVESMERARLYRAEIAHWAHDRKIHVHFRLLVEPTWDLLENTMREENCGLLVLPDLSGRLDQDALVEFLERLNIPVLLVR